MRERLRRNGLSLCFALLFVLALAGQALSGLADFNDRQLADGLQTISLTRYLTSAEFGVDVAENWQSEYLQFFLYITLTVWLVQRGSPESKQLDEAGRESDEDQRVGRYAGPGAPAWARAAGLRRVLYSHSLSLTMGLIFLLSWLGQSAAGVVAFNAAQLRSRQEPVSWGQYLLTPEFWNRTFQNWQSELLAVFSMVVLAIYLRERGSPESKPVGSPHTATGVEG